MDIYIYSDESGVFDKVHNDFFVFAGVLFLTKQQRDICSHKYSKVEKSIRDSENISYDKEIKAATITNKNKGKLFRSLNSEQKFAVVLNQKTVLNQIFNSKKDKQRYLDYVYKIGVKRKFENLIEQSVIVPAEVERLNFFVDEHTTATNGRYELKEALEQEFKRGTYNGQYDKFFPPIFPHLKSVELKYCNSSSNLLIRAADIVANNVYYKANKGDLFFDQENKLYVSRLP